MQIRFREATVDDLPFLVNGTLAIHQHEKMGPDIELALVANFEEQLGNWLRTVLDEPQALVLVAYADSLDGKALGFILAAVAPQPNTFTPYPCHGLIQSLWVEPAYRKLKIGSHLLKQMEAIFAKQQVPYCEVQYTPRNEEAQRFWQHHGYLPYSVSNRKHFTGTSD